MAMDSPVHAIKRMWQDVEYKEVHASVVGYAE